MKRMIALVLSLVMALSLCAPAWGATASAATADELVEALEGGNDVVMTDNIDIDPAKMSNAYGKTGIVIKNGQVLDGNNKILAVKGANNTWDSGVCVIDGTLKNVTVTDSFRGIFIRDNTQKVFLENVTTKGTVYTISVDQGGGGGLEATNCTFNGWTSFAATLGEATFTNCIFGEGSGYKFCRPYAPTAFVGCAFSEGFKVDPVAAVSFENCTLNGVALTAQNIDTLVTSTANVVSVDGHLPGAVAKVGDVEYKTLQAAVAAGGTVKLLSDVTASEVILINKNVTINGNGHKVSSSASRVFRVTTANTEVTMNNVNVVSTAVRVNTPDIRGISVDDVAGVSLTLNDCSVDFTDASANDYAYGVNQSGEASTGNTITINGGSYEGANTINIWGTGHDIEIKDAKLISTYGENAQYAGQAIRLESPSNKLNVSNVVTEGSYAFTLGVELGDSEIQIKGLASGAAFEFEDSDLSITGGYFTKDPSAYCAEGLTGVASDKAGYLYMVGKKGVTVAEVKPADPEVDVNENLTGDNKTAADAIAATGGVTLDNAALNAVAKDVANENKETVTEAHVGELKGMTGNSTITETDVVVVVKPYFDVAVNDVEIVKDETTGNVTSASIELNITPMYQKVVTTEAVATTSATEIKTEGADKNAIEIGEPQKMTITEPVTITVKIPDALAIADGNGGFKPLFVTHKASSGTYIYEATVAGTTGAYTATFTNPHGFSSFSISIVDDTVAEVGTDKYTNLQDAINNAGKDATITVVKAGNHTATVKGETSFKVELENGATVNISAAPGYKLSGPDANGVYTVTKVTGGYYPYYPTNPDKLVESAKTADPVALYFGVTALATLGSALLLKKKED